MSKMWFLWSVIFAFNNLGLVEQAVASNSNKNLVPPCLQASNNELQRHAEKFFDFRCLSNEHASVVLQIDQSSKYPSAKIKNASGTKADVFYAEQAFWESRPLASDQRQNGGEVLVFGKFGSTGNFPELISSEKSNIVKLHLIPMSAENLGTISSEKIRTPDNVLKLSVDKANDPALLEFRKEWIDFLSTHKNCSETEVLSEANRLKTKYERLFL